jgi:hypothetical protein
MALAGQVMLVIGDSQVSGAEVFSHQADATAAQHANAVTEATIFQP